jgi:hypothetical protein
LTSGRAASAAGSHFVLIGKWADVIAEHRRRITVSEPDYPEHDGASVVTVALAVRS